VAVDRSFLTERMGRLSLAELDFVLSGIVVKLGRA